MGKFVVSGALAGLIAGLFLSFKGLSKNQMPLDMMGFVLCIGYGALLGLILAVPCASCFWRALRKTENKSSEYKD